MSKHKKRVSVAQRPADRQPVAEPQAMDRQPQPDEDTTAAAHPVSAEGDDPLGLAAEYAGDGGSDDGTPGIETHPIFWFSLGALTVGIIVLIGMLLLTGSPRPAAAAPAAKAPAGTAPSSVTAGVVQLPQLNYTATVTAAVQINQSVPRASLEEAKRKLDAGQALLVDVRAKQTFDAQHIKGAVNIPEEDTQKRLAEFPKDKDIILYCS